MASEVSGPRFPASTLPFLLPAGSSGALLLHGLSATPEEMRFLGDHLHARGHSVNAVRLAGHGTSVDDLERCRWQDWYASARQGLSTLQQHASHITVVGLSMGALLAVQLAASHGDAVSGLVLLAPAMVVRHPGARWIARLFPIASPFLVGRYRRLNKGPRDVADPHARARSPCYPSLPLRSVRELVLLQHAARRRLAHVHQPTLIIHSTQDHTCPIKNVTMLERAIAGPVRTVVLRDSYHVISIDVDKERVADEVGAFMEHIVRQN